jgi:hypothetical protein
MNNDIKKINSITGKTYSEGIPTSPRPDGRKSVGGNNHRPLCECSICTNIRARITTGRPAKATQRAIARQRRLEAAKAKTTPRTRRERQIAKDTAVNTAIATQVMVGVRPSIVKTAQIAGVSRPTAARAMKGNDFVAGALSRAGIDDDKLATVAAEGLEAKFVKILTDREGQVTSKIETPDYTSRHLYWRDVLMAKGILGNDRESQGSGGGLIIIAPEAASLVEGHPPTCICQECIDAWNVKHKSLSERALREMAVDAEVPDEPPDFAVPEIDDDDWDDFGEE